MRLSPRLQANSITLLLHSQVLRAPLSARVHFTSTPAALPGACNDRRTAWRAGRHYGPSWVSSLDPSLTASATYNGGIIALPNQLTVMGPIVNVAMFQKAGVAVPTINSTWTWPQLVSAAEKVQAANHTPFALAIDHSGDRIANVFAQYGTFLYGTSGTGTWNTQQATSAMTELASLLKANEISKAAWIAGGTKYLLLART